MYEVRITINGKQQLHGAAYTDNPLDLEHTCRSHTDRQCPACELLRRAATEAWSLPDHHPQMVVIQPPANYRPDPEMVRRGFMAKPLDIPPQVSEMVEHFDAAAELMEELGLISLSTKNLRVMKMYNAVEGR